MSKPRCRRIIQTIVITDKDKLVSLTRALRIVFNDPHWQAKLIITSIVTLISSLLTPLLIGLAGWAALLGYVVEVVYNIRAERPHPLPGWERNFERFLRRGAGVMVAFILYNLPNFLLACCIAFAAPSLDNRITGPTVILLASCCLIPLLLVYNLLIWALLSLGVGRYSDHPATSVFFQFGSLFGLLRENSDVVIQYLITCFLANLLFAAVGVIPILGWLALAGLAVPLQAVITGLFCARLLGRPRR